MNNKDMIEEYLNNISISQKYDENYKTFLNLVSFLEEIDDIDVNDIIILENENVHSLIQSIVEYNMDKIKDDKINEICKNDIGIKLINSYCTLNNVYENIIKLSNDNDILNTYLKSISKFPVLTREQERYLFNKLHDGDENARTVLINCNLKLVVNIAKQYNNIGIDMMDLIQDGNNRLVYIIDRFDINRNIKFSTYVYTCITRYLEYTIPISFRKIRIPHHLYHDVQKYIAVREKLENEFGGEITLDDIAKKLNWPKSKVEEIDNLQYDACSLNTIVMENDHNNDIELESLIPADIDDLDIIYEKGELKNNLIKLILNCGLDKTEIFIIMSRLNGLKFQTIAKNLGITYQRVEQIEKKAMNKIIKNRKIDDFAIYMDDEQAALKNLNKKRETSKKKKKN